ncbi:MAG: NADH-quinone oxidoreductase subunit L [Phycisphaerales bacterium]|nr:NADH-quinone oxidoreductase subunit L [Phycisphaerales bacterium]
MLGTLAQHGTDTVGDGAAAAGAHVAHAAESIAAATPGAELMLAVPALTLLAAILCGLCAAFRVRSKLPAWLSVGCLGASFVCVLLTYLNLAGEHGAGGIVPRIAHGFEWLTFQWGRGGTGGEGRSFVADFSLYVDSLTCLWMLFVTGLATLIGLYASEYMVGDVKTAGYSRFFAAFNLFVLSMSCLVMADNLVLLYLGWEGVGLCSYLLIGYFYKKPSAVAAAKKAFIMNRIGDLGLSLGLMLTFVHFGTVQFNELWPLIQSYASGATPTPFIVQLIPVLFTVGAFGKSAQIPLYVWLPDAMEGPTPVSALIHAATMVTAGVYLVARFLPIYALSEWALPIVAWGGALTALLAATIGMAQFDIKRIMAYSTVSQLGYMFAGLGVLGSVGAASHVFTHAFFKALLFLACGAVMHGFAGQLDLRKLSGVQKMPGWRIVGLTMLVGCLNLAGFPLITAGFWSKDMILADAFSHPQFRAIGWILLITAGLTAYYTFRVYFRVFMGPKYFEPGDELHAAAHGDDHGEAHDAAGHVTHSAAPHGQHMAAEGALAAKGHAHDHGHADAHGVFHPHPPGWAINLVLTILALATFAAIPLFFIGDHHGWVGDLVHGSSSNPASAAAAHEAAMHGHGPHGGSFLGMDPHAVMYYVSAVVGIIGIGIAFVLHLAGRTTPATSRADALLPALGPIARAAQHKWYVDELYGVLFVTPLRVLSHIFHLIDKLLVDGLVNLFGWLPRGIGSFVRRSQSGVLHDYGLRMASGLAIILLIVLLGVLR